MTATKSTQSPDDNAMLAIAKEVECTKGRLIVIQDALTLLFRRASPTAIEDLRYYLDKYEIELSRRTKPPETALQQSRDEGVDIALSDFRRMIDLLGR